MYKTVLFMIAALVFTVLSAMISNDFGTHKTIVAANEPHVAGPVSNDYQMWKSDAVDPVAPLDATDEDITLPEKRAAALLFMGVLRDN